MQSSFTARAKGWHGSRLTVGERGTLAAMAVGWLAVGIAVRIILLPHESWDYRTFVGSWVETFEREGFGALATPFADYAPAYLYFVWAISKLPVDSMMAVKLLSISFDVVLALGVAALARVQGLDGRRAVTLFGFVLLLPTVVLNSAAWAQCDAIYAAAVIAGLVLVSRGSMRMGVLGFLAVGVGIAFKAQAAFVLPFLLVLSLRREAPWRAWLALPLPYLAFAVPAAIAGRPVMDILAIYLSQSEKYRDLTLNAPTVYAWLPNRQSWGEPGIWAGGAMIGACALLAARYASRRPGADRLALMTFLLALVPFVLPRMHDRYFYLADVTAVAYAFLRPSRWFVPMLIVAASTASYFPFLYRFEVVPLPLAAALMAVALGVLAMDVFPAVRRVVARAYARASYRVTDRGWVPVAVQFACVGAGSTLLFLVIYAGLRRFMEPAGANATGLMLTMVLNFAANRYSSFRKRRHSLRAEFPWYLAIYFAGLGASILAFHVAWMLTGGVASAFLELILVVGSGAVGTMLRFVLLTQFVYRERRTARTPRGAEGPPDTVVPRVAAAGGGQAGVMSRRD